MVRIGRVSTALRFMVVMAILCNLVPADAQGTIVGFYKQTCPSAEKLVQLRVKKKFSTDKTIVPALLRMHFHDCFVKGCDASLLVDSTPGNQAEKEAGPNQTVRGFEFIDEIKKVLEAVCPSTVSCADIIALATRDAVALVTAFSLTFDSCLRNFRNIASCVTRRGSSLYYRFLYDSLWNFQNRVDLIGYLAVFFGVT